MAAKTIDTVDCDKTVSISLGGVPQRIPPPLLQWLTNLTLSANGTSQNLGNSAGGNIADGITKKTDSLHVLLGNVVMKMIIMFHHLAISMTKPAHDDLLRNI